MASLSYSFVLGLLCNMSRSEILVILRKEKPVLQRMRSYVERDLISV
jgi:hypothetical protein